jgi:hypothetical protein
VASIVCRIADEAPFIIREGSIAHIPMPAIIMSTIPR